MNRHQALQTLAGGLLLTPPSFPVQASADSSTFLADFLLRWKNAREYSLKVLDRMPAELYGYKPVPEVMTFGKQYTHAGHWNTFFIGTLVNQPPLPEPTEIDKATVRDYYVSCFDHCTSIIEKLTESQLSQTGYGTHEYWKKHTGRDYLLRAFMHVAHHRAETLIYLRLNGIEPPFFEF